MNLFFFKKIYHALIYPLGEFTLDEEGRKKQSESGGVPSFSLLRYLQSQIKQLSDTEETISKDISVPFLI